jgi:hypothetical protein
MLATLTSLMNFTELLLIVASYGLARFFGGPFTFVVLRFEGALFSTSSPLCASWDQSTSTSVKGLNTELDLVVDLWSSVIIIGGVIPDPTTRPV